MSSPLTSPCFCLIPPIPFSQQPPGAEFQWPQPHKKKFYFPLFFPRPTLATDKKQESLAQIVTSCLAMPVPSWELLALKQSGKCVGHQAEFFPWIFLAFQTRTNGKHQDRTEQIHLEGINLVLGETRELYPILGIIYKVIMNFMLSISFSSFCFSV